MTKPKSNNEPMRIAITMGDPAGVGPEVIVGSWCDARLRGINARFVIGRRRIIDRAIQLLGVRLRTIAIESPADAVTDDGLIPVLELETDCDGFTPSSESALGGRAAMEAVRRGVELALAGVVDALVTAPLNKAAIHAAGFEVPGHTEYLAQLCGAKNVAMMLYLPPDAIASHRGTRETGDQVGLGVVHVTLHTALRKVFDELSTELIVDRCDLADRFVSSLLQSANLSRAARIGVAALNPHAGEGGLFGNEEAEIIAPAVARARTRGVNATGPLPCDTLMHRAAAGEFDAVVAMYHDQGHIALKLLGLQRAVNVTLGLPIVRTSVAHGTAFDIAWRGLAQSGSMVEAIVTADRLARARSAF
jgi:4-hydroxythreonine-4-phosphate dehydrogenase